MVAIRALRKELVGKAKKGTLVYTDIPLVQKLESAPKVNPDGIKNTENDKDLDRSSNITRPVGKKCDSEYYFARLKRDVELGDERAIEVVEKVKNGVYTSARQVALEMGYRKPVKQKCLPKDTKKAVEKIVRELGKAKKGTLVYTDIPLVQKLESAPKVNLHQRPETSNNEDVDKGVNINTLKSRSDTQDYIFGRLKRDAELVGKAKKGTLVYTDIPLVQKLESAPKIIKHGENETQTKEKSKRLDNINKSEYSGDSQDYIFGRLKRNRSHLV